MFPAALRAQVFGSRYQGIAQRGVGHVLGECLDLKFQCVKGFDQGGAVPFSTVVDQAQRTQGAAKSRTLGQMPRRSR